MDEKSVCAHDVGAKIDQTGETAASGELERAR
jgi:hypothetical protein